MRSETSSSHFAGTPGRIRQLFVPTGAVGERAHWLDDEQVAGWDELDRAGRGWCRARRPQSHARGSAHRFRRRGRGGGPRFRRRSSPAAGVTPLPLPIRTAAKGHASARWYAPPGMRSRSRRSPAATGPVPIRSAPAGQREVLGQPPLVRLEAPHGRAAAPRAGSGGSCSERQSHAGWAGNAVERTRLPQPPRREARSHRRDDRLEPGAKWHRRATATRSCKPTCV